ncbi:MAG: radical SAM protein [Candidatus Omnitrophota bacterium]
MSTQRFDGQKAWARTVPAASFGVNKKETDLRVTFVAMSYESLAVSQLSAVAKAAGHQVSLAFTPSLFDDCLHMSMPSIAKFFDETGAVLKKIEDLKPDVIAFSPLSGMYQWALKISCQAKLRCPRVKIVFGGIHASAEPGRVIKQPQIDYICIGEGDLAFLKILEHIRRGGEDPVANTWYKTGSGQVIRGEQAGFIQNLDQLPIPDKTLWEEYLPNNDFYITSAMRGCPNRCAYCFNSFYPDLARGNPGNYLRRRSPAHLMRELRVYKKRYRFRVVEFFDDVFTIDVRWLKEFARLYRRDIGVPYQIFTHVKYIDEERACLLAESGCVAAQMGMQSLDDEYKRRVLNRNESTEDAGWAIDLLNRYGVKPKMDHMLGLPGEPIEAQEKAARFYAEHKPYRIQTYWTNYFPGTKLLRQAEADGSLTSEEADRLKDGFDMDTFTRANKMIDEKKIKIYRACELLYKLLPSLPYAMRKRLSYKQVSWMPRPLLFFFAFFSDMLIGLSKLDRDHVSYAKTYLYWIGRHIFQRTGIPFLPATRIYDRAAVDFYPFEKGKQEAERQCGQLASIKREEGR